MQSLAKKIIFHLSSVGITPLTSIGDELKPQEGTVRWTY